jgi:hypothetical protein
MPDLGLPYASGAERRLHPREATSEAVKLVSGTGAVFDAVVVDRSLRGMRIEFGGVSALPSEVTVLSPATGSAYLARVVWRTAPYAGLMVTRTVDMRTATGSDTANLRKLWREHIAR